MRQPAPRPTPPLAVRSRVCRSYLRRAAIVVTATGLCARRRRGTSPPSNLRRSHAHGRRKPPPAIQAVQNKVVSRNIARLCVLKANQFRFLTLVHLNTR
eukprot:6206558-Pleurochrysis_carterae.AAC.3